MVGIAIKGLFKSEPDRFVTLKYYYQIASKSRKMRRLLLGKGTVEYITNCMHMALGHESGELFHAERRL